MNGRKEPRFWTLVAGVVALVLLLVIAVVALSRPGRAPVTATAASRKHLLVPILSDGTLETPEGGELRAPESARVAEIPVKEGARVHRGDVLVRLDSPSLSNRSRDASALASELAAERVRAEADLAAGQAEEKRLKETVEAE